VAGRDVEVVRRAYEAYARGEVVEVVDAYSEDTVFDVSQFRPDVGVSRGLAEAAEGLRTWRGTWDEHFFSLEQVVDAGDCVVTVIREGGKGRESGADVVMHYGQVIKVRDGKIAETVVYRDPADAFRAAGLPAPG
jgi:ketosteroid isomerase-like protein